jgi:hypothetical protein
VTISDQSATFRTTTGSQTRESLFTFSTPAGAVIHNPAKDKGDGSSDLFGSWIYLNFLALFIAILRLRKFKK